MPRVLLAAFAVFAMRPTAAPMDIPLVDLTYSFDFDESCADRVDSPLDRDAVEELERLMPRLEEAWRDDGPPLLLAAREAVGRPFGFRRATARLLTCDVASRSRPLVINVRPYLRATMGRRRVALRQFASTVVHEVLHRYVADMMADRGIRETALLRKYAAEPQLPLHHIKPPERKNERERPRRYTPPTLASRTAPHPEEPPRHPERPPVVILSEAKDLLFSHSRSFGSEPTEDDPQDDEGGC